MAYVILDSDKIEHMIRRPDVRAVKCPKCGADPKLKCLGARGKRRKANHIERWAAFKRSYSVPSTR